MVAAEDWDGALAVGADWPVVLVDGRLLSFWHVHEQPLRKAILAP